MIGAIKPLFKQWPLIEGVNDDRPCKKRCLTLEPLFPGMEIIAKPFAMEAVAAKRCEALSSAVFRALCVRPEISQRMPFMPRDITLQKERLAEAARYALLRRLAPAIRHDMAGSLQPIRMIAAMLEKRLQAAAPDLAQLGKNASAINTLSREAGSSCLNLMTWLAPRDNDPVPLNSAVEESLGLLTAELSFRGFAVVNQTVDMQAQLPRGIFRSVFTASMMALTDALDGAVQLVVSATAVGHETRLQITIEPGGSTEFAGLGGRSQAYRSMGWDDVLALADAEGVSLTHAADHAELRYCATAASG